MTRQRALILDIMREKSPQHLTADELFNEDGEIGHLEMPGGPDRYDYNPSPHGHLLCDGCGHLADLPVVGLMREVEAAIGTEVRGYTLTIHYLCPKCRAAKPADE